MQRYPLYQPSLLDPTGHPLTQQSLLSCDGLSLAKMINEDAAKGRAVTFIKQIRSDQMDLRKLEYARLLESGSAVAIKLPFSGRDPQSVLNLVQSKVEPVV